MVAEEAEEEAVALIIEPEVEEGAVFHSHYFHWTVAAAVEEMNAAKKVKFVDPVVRSSRTRQPNLSMDRVTVAVEGGHVAALVATEIVGEYLRKVACDEDSIVEILAVAAEHAATAGKAVVAMAVAEEWMVAS